MSNIWRGLAVALLALALSGMLTGCKEAAALAALGIDLDCEDFT